MNSNKEKPLISIITVVYNSAKTLEQTINSVLNQTYTNIEYIIIDGKSTDGSVEIIKKYAERVTYWVSEKDAGIYDAMNKGLTKANGFLIGIINADDWYEPDAISNVVEAYYQFPDFHVFHGLLRFINLKEKFVSVAGHDISFIKSGMIEHPTCFIKASFYRKIGYFDTQYRAASDYDFMNRAVKYGAKFCFIDHILANFRLGGVSLTEKSAQEELKIKYHYGHISKFKYMRWHLFLKVLFKTRQ